MKTCRACGESKPLTDYHIERRVKDGRRAICKRCEHARIAEQRRSSQAAAKHRAAARRHYDRNADAEREARRADYAANPEREAAHRAVRDALAAGTLVRPSECQNCGARPEKGADGRAQIEAHHPDYARPLDVEWLCGICHRAADAVDKAQAAQLSSA